MTPEAWSQELEYWGLAERAELDANGLLVRPLESLSLQELGQKIVTDIRENEYRVIRTIFDLTGYFATDSKTRHVSLHIPLDVYPLGRGIDLGRYIEKYTDVLTQHLKTMINGKSNVVIKKLTKACNDRFYEFQGQSYSSHTTPTMQIEIEFIEFVT
jgi:hypothetical protein